jgi:Mg2+-importing ATPase
LRSRLPVLRSLPSRAMVVVTALVIAVTVAVPYSPLASLLGLKALSPLYLLVLAVIVAIYFASAEFTKRLFYRAQLDRDLFQKATR